MIRIRPKAASWVRTPKSHPQASRDLGDAQEDCEGLAHPMLWARPVGSLRWLQPLVTKDQTDHQPQEQQAAIGEARKLGEPGVPSRTQISPPLFLRSRKLLYSRIRRSHAFPLILAHHQRT